jgi:hypothetical protein
MYAAWMHRRAGGSWRGCCLACAVIVALASPWAWGAERPLLIEQHKAAGLACDACHSENPPKAAATMAACQQCHGEYAKLAQKTQEVKPKNPHESHEGEMECGECHHVHKASVDYCAKCHDFGFKVP